MNPPDVQILVIDDEAPNRLLISRQLQRDGYQVATASSGAEGLAYLDHHNVSLIFLDLLMPEMSGYEVLGHLKADPNLAAISVVIVSAIDDLKEIVRCLEMGADDYILKPVNPLLLRIRLHTCLERQWLRQQEQAYLQQLRAERDLAEAANRARSTFLANMSHELRTPLNAVIGYTDMLREEFEAEGYADYLGDLEKIRGSSQHLLGLISDILDMSKLESGTMELNLETFDLWDVLDQVEFEMRSPVAATVNTLTLNLQLPNPLPIHTDRDKLRQILLNLLSNALKFTPRGEIRLSAALETRSSTGDWVRFTVVDPGIGIPPEQRARIFQPFTQVDDSTTRLYGGTGLGLAICHRLTQMLGGTIQVDSVENQGTTVTLELPTQRTLSDAIAARELRGSPASSVSASVRDGDPRLVLVIDGDRVVRDWMVQHLSRAGCRVITSWNGQEGLRLAGDLRPALILMGVSLSGAGNWSTLASLKANPSLREIPVVLHALQPSSTPETLQGTLLGACHYLTKPDYYPHILTLLAPYGRPAAAADDPPKSVLLIQRDRTSRYMLQRLLTRHQWQVHTAVTLPEAIAQPSTPDVIILDVGILESSTIPVWLDLQARSPTISIIYVLTQEPTPADPTSTPAHLYRHLAEHLKNQVDAALWEGPCLPRHLDACIRAYCRPTH